MMSPASLLTRLGELKKWQEAQQERLMRQHNKRLQETEHIALANYEDIEGVARLDGEGEKRVKFEEKVLSPPKDFQALLEEKLADENLTNSEANGKGVKPKRPFLKKGSGLSRYRMSLDGRNKPPVGRKVGAVVKKTDLKPPQVAVQLKAKWNATEQERQSESPFDTPRSSASMVNSFNRRVIAQINRFATGNLNVEEAAEDLGNKDVYSDRELLIFEKLEKRAMNSSFSSTNSSIVRLLSSTPQNTSPRKVYKPPIHEENHNAVSDDSELIEKIIYQQLQGGDIESLLQRLQNYQAASEETTPTIERNESSCSSVNSDDVRDCIAAAGKDARNESASPEPIVKEMKDAATCTDFSSECEDNEVTIGNMTAKEILTQKLEDLEREIERFRIENARVAQLRRDLEIERREFQREKKKLVGDLENEREELHMELEEERRKFAKEKMVFERHTKELLKKPTKQERAEISNLKVELENLRETQKLKDTKNSTTQARLRNQIKSLEKDRANLQEEVEKLTKQNAKLLATQKINARPPSDTKMLHEINKNLSKLAKGARVTEKPKKANRSAEKCFIIESCSDDEDESVVKMSEKNLKANKAIGFEGAKSEVEDVRNNNQFPFYGSGGKENDRNVGNSFEGFDIEKHYEEVFGRNAGLNEQRIPNTTVNESRKGLDDEVETVLSDGSREVKYSNGNVKTTSPDGNLIKTKYFNGDHKETNLTEGYIKYFYEETKAWQTTYADGTEILEFPNGQVEKKLSDGTSEIRFPDGIVRKIMPDGSEEITYLDGSVVTISTKGDRVLLLPNGQKEIHTEEHKRREYPDGTVKILYPDGTQETRYSNGRIRIKDKEGNLLMDSFS